MYTVYTTRRSEKVMGKERIDGEAVRRARLDMGLTLAEFGLQIGVVGSSVHNYEMGMMPLPRTMKRLCDLTRQPREAFLVNPQCTQRVGANGRRSQK
jgi:transcriptional regulator with XRE-family HTH domain